MVNDVFHLSDVFMNNGSTVFSYEVFPAIAAAMHWKSGYPYGLLAHVVIGI